MSNARDIIIRPLVTEKTLKSQDTNKIQIKQAVEEIFGVKVEKINVANTKSKTKRVGRYVGKTHAFKKAYVTLKEGHKIDILSDK